MARYEKAIALDPSYVQAHWRRGGLHRTEGRFVEAIAEFQTAVTLAHRNPSALAELATAYALAGRRSEAEALLAEMHSLASQRYASPAAFGWVYTALGDHDRAFEWLDKASQERSNFIVYLVVDPRVASLRGDPRFRALAQRVGLPL